MRESNLQWPRLAHLISLKNIGGVERYFARFYSHYGKHLPLEILLQTDEIHPMIRSAFSDDESHLHRIKGPGQRKLPRVLGWRNRYQKKLADELAPDATLVWNKLVGNPMPLLESHPTFHYEHGTSWVAHPDESSRRYLDRLSGIVAVSKAAKRMLELRWHIDISLPIDVIHNAIDLPSVQSPHPEGRFRLGFAARLKGLKAPIVALEAFHALQAKIPHAELWIAGQGPLEPILREWVGRWKLDDHVRFCGLVDDMSGFYTNLDAFICPSWREPFGLVAQEAIAYGLPTLVSNVDGLPESLLDASHGAVIEPTRPKSALAYYGEACVEGPDEVYSPSQDDLVGARVIDPEEAAEVLANWAASPTLRRKIGNNARHRLRAEQNMQCYGDQLMAFVQRHL